MSKACSACRGCGQVPITWDGHEVFAPCSRCAGTGRVSPIAEVILAVAATNGIDAADVWGMSLADFAARVAARAEHQPQSERPTLLEGTGR